MNLNAIADKAGFGRYNAGARAGDRLVLTKRLGIGVLSTALKRGLITEDEMMPAIKDAATLNSAAAQAMKAAGAHACTDVTGFGLLGHLREMLEAGGVAAEVFVEDVPVRAGIEDLIAQDVYAGGLRANRDYLVSRVTGRALDEPATLALVDPQTSGGLLIAVAPETSSSCTTSSLRGAPKAGPSARSCMGRPARWPCCERRGPDGEAQRGEALRSLAAVDQVLREPRSRS